MSHKTPDALDRISEIEGAVTENYTYDLDNGPPAIGVCEFVACETYVYDANVGADQQILNSPHQVSELDGEELSIETYTYDLADGLPDHGLDEALGCETYVYEDGVNLSDNQLIRRTSSQPKRMPVGARSVRGKAR